MNCPYQFKKQTHGYCKYQCNNILNDCTCGSVSHLRYEDSNKWNRPRWFQSQNTCYLDERTIDIQIFMFFLKWISIGAHQLSQLNWRQKAAMSQRNWVVFPVSSVLKVTLIASSILQLWIHVFRYIKVHLASSGLLLDGRESLRWTDTVAAGPRLPGAKFGDLLGSPTR